MECKSATAEVTECKVASATATACLVPQPLLVDPIEPIDETDLSNYPDFLAQSWRLIRTGSANPPTTLEAQSWYLTTTSISDPTDPPPDFDNGDI